MSIGSIGSANDPGVLEPLAVTLGQAGRLLGIGQSKLYELIDAGQIETATLGKRRVVIVASLKALLDRNRSIPSDTKANWTPPRPMRRRGPAPAA